MSHLTGTYKLDPAHSSIGFTVRHAMVTKVRGEFTDHDATITLTDDLAQARRKAPSRRRASTRGTKTVTRTCAARTSST